MKKRMNKVQDMVLFELEARPETRSSDRELIMAIYRDFYGVTTDSFMKVMHRTDLPKFESIRRARQKLQETEEDLRAVPEVEQARLDLQEEYIAYARGE